MGLLMELPIGLRIAFDGLGGQTQIPDELKS